MTGGQRENSTFHIPSTLPPHWNKSRNTGQWHQNHFRKNVANIYPILCQVLPLSRWRELNSVRALFGSLSNICVYFAEDCRFSRDLFLKHTEQKKMLKAKIYIYKILLKFSSLNQLIQNTQVWKWITSLRGTIYKTKFLQQSVISDCPTPIKVSPSLLLLTWLLQD